MIRRLTWMALCALAVTAGAFAAERQDGYMGIATEPVDPALAEHLGLPEGTGLVVAHVDADGPSAKALEENDVLYSIDGQVLVNHEQLATIVRKVHKAGDKIEVKVYRKGNERTETVELAKAPDYIARRSVRDPLRLAPPYGQPQPGAPFQRWPGQGAFGQGGFNLGPGGGNFPQDLENLQEHIQGFLDQMQQQPGWRNRRHWRPNEEDQDDDSGTIELKPSEEDQDAAPDTQVQSFSSTEIHTKAMTSEGGLTVTLESDGNTKHLKAERDGKVIFDGPVDTEEQRAELPDDVKDRLGSLEKQVHVNINVGGAAAPAPRHKEKHDRSGHSENRAISI